ncbi:hypothetical protein APICC_08433 [Apis cerana cerana]|uniref:Uncharacterized protein n=1 Tax=Apis cerana cerana TaxID=94128 RepID=A0A2A3E8L8_APICC|nr:hypothetical protein APICC_08433 [Apis cerana cerana]
MQQLIRLANFLGIEENLSWTLLKHFSYLVSGASYSVTTSLKKINVYVARRCPRMRKSTIDSETNCIWTAETSTSTFPVFNKLIGYPVNSFVHVDVLKEIKIGVLFFLKEVVQHIKENWHEYGPFVIAEWNISDRQTYDNYMSMVGTFASELECTVATKLYDMNLSIYREINDRHELKRVFYNHVSSHFETARLLFTGNSDSGHYDVLVPD